MPGLMPRIGSFNRERTGLDTAEDVEDVLDLDVMYARAEIDSVTGVETHAVLGDAAQRMVDRLDTLRNPLAAVVHALVGMADLIGDQLRVVDLHEESGVDDRPVFLA